MGWDQPETVSVYERLTYIRATAVYTSSKRMELTEFEEAMAVAVASLKEGEVASYGDIAAAAGRPNAPRAAGRLLSRSMVTLPWWRVVYASGKLPGCNPTAQAELLRTEGVRIKNACVVAAPHGRFAKKES